MKRFTIFLLAVFAACDSVSAQAPREELRGVFLTTSNSLDWPKSYDRNEQQASLKRILRDMKAANLNTLFFQIRPRGDAYYQSQFEPWAQSLTGTLGEDPGWDPLAFALEEAHALGIEVHAWFNVFKIRGQLPLTKAAPGSKPHPTLAYPDWTLYYDKEAWLNPGLPHARAYILRVLMDMMRRYDVDGVCFDFIRYPGTDFDDRDAYNWYGNGKPIADWRRGNVNAFVREAYDSIMRAKPIVKVGAAPVGNYKGNLSAQSSGNTVGGAYDWYSQDGQGWLKNGWLDYLAPQVYWKLAFDSRGADFAHIAHSWQKNSNGRHIYLCIGAYKEDILEQIPHQITAARKVGAHGQVYFRYENVKDMNIFGTHYAEPAVIPVMPWKPNSSTQNTRK